MVQSNLITFDSVPLTNTEQAELAFCENRMEQALDVATAASITLATCLKQIHEKRLYRSYGTFDAYCRERWQRGRHWGYHLIEAAHVLNTLTENVDNCQHPLPTTEAQIRPLTRLEPEEQPIAWQRAVDTAPNGKMTAAHVEQVVKHFRQPEPDSAEAADLIMDEWQNNTLDPPMELEQVADQFPEELTTTDRELLQEDAPEELDSNEWYTPVEFIEAARAVMGSIDVDPASNDTAQAFIRAGIHYTKETNGLAQSWGDERGGNVWLNPPYAEPLPWIEKLLAEFEAGHTKQAILLVNTANSPQWSRLLWHSNFAVCLLDRRVRFWRPDRTEAKGTAQDQMIWYIGYETDAFRNAFEKHGAIR